MPGELVDAEGRVGCAYRVQLPRNRAAQIIVLWSLVIFCCVNLLKGILLEKLYYHQIVWQIVLNYTFSFSIFVIYPISSFLGDVYFKRFTIIRTSLVVLWLGVLVSVVVLVFEDVYQNTPLVSQSPFYSMYIVLYVTLSIGMIGFHANMIPFGLEQLHASPAEEVVAFLHCYIFTEALGLVIANAFIPNCATIGKDSASNQSVLIQSAVCALLMTMAFIFIVLLRHLRVFLVEDPAVYNPLILICSVLKHTVKTKSWPSESSVWWTEMASTKPFMPYTADQLYDVRGFFRLCPILLPYFVIMIGNVTTITLAMFAVHLNWNGDEAPEHCFAVMTIGNLPGITVVFIVLLYHFIIYPMFHKYIPSMLTRLIIGIIFFAASTSCCLIIDLIGHHHSSVKSVFKDTAFDNSIVTLNIPFIWAMIPGLLSGVANFTVTASMYEFICAQAPYGMKGLLVGLKYGTAGMGVLLGFATLLVFRGLHEQLDYIYYLLNILVFVISIIIVLVYKLHYTPFRSSAFETQAIESGNYQSDSSQF